MDEVLKNTILETQGDLLYTTLSEECGEVIQACSKIIRKKFYEETFDITNLLEEIGDIEINLELIKEQLVRETLILTREDVDKRIEQWKEVKYRKLEKVFLDR